VRIILTGGGTGGHLYPALAILEALRERTDIEALFIGTRRGLESRIVPDQGIPFKTVWISGISRGRFWGNLLFPLKMGVSLIQATLILSRCRPDAVIGTGGYVSWPVLRAGQLLKKKTFLQEQNHQPGLVTRVLSRRVTRLYLSFEKTRSLFTRQDHLLVTGNPTRATLRKADRNMGVRTFRLDPNKKVLFIFGGSQGARGLNRAMVSVLPALMQATDWQILWATGPRWEKEIREASKTWSKRAQVLPYIEAMGAAYAASDLVICRAGATTISEVTQLGLPVLFIPFPAAAEGHQETNARVLADAGAAEMVLESEIHGRLLSCLLGLIDDPQRRKDMGEKAKTFGRPFAARDIATDVLVHLGNRTESEKKDNA
jgi:UDP-N-acetylglucosamine--N-acetylmuramyl-(pentapeptide) pyrophosphoryl-undecaprenol N-acetylglucosamine transferase